MMNIDIKIFDPRSTGDLSGHVNDPKSAMFDFIEIFHTAWFPKLCKKIRSVNTSVLLMARAIR